MQSLFKFPVCTYKVRRQRLSWPCSLSNCTHRLNWTRLGIDPLIGYHCGAEHAELSC